MNPLHPVVMAVQARYAEAFDPFLVWFDHELGPELAEARPAVWAAWEDEVDEVADGARPAVADAGVAARCAVAGGRVGVVVEVRDQSEEAHVE